MIELERRLYDLVSPFYLGKNLMPLSFSEQFTHLRLFKNFQWFVACLPLRLSCRAERTGPMSLWSTLDPQPRLSVWHSVHPVHCLHVVIADELRGATQQGTWGHGLCREEKLSTNMTSLVYFLCTLGKLLSFSDPQFLKCKTGLIMTKHIS